MFSNLFWIKFSLRVMKIVSFAYLSYYIISLKVGTKLSASTKDLFYIAFILATAAGPLAFS